MNENLEIQQTEKKQKILPNSIACLILGILSINTAFAYGTGLILAIIALNLAKASRKIYNTNPDLYLPGSYKIMDAGRKCAKAGLIVSIVIISIIILGIIVAITTATTVFGSLFFSQICKLFCV